MSGRNHPRAMVGVVGLAGHALPAIALARELRARGHEVRFHTYERWREAVEGIGAEFAGGGDEIVASSPGEGSPPDGTVVGVVRSLLPSVEEFRPDIVISDGLTLTPALAAELSGRRWATLFPEVYPVHAPGLPFFSLGLLAPRTRLGAAAWRALGPALETRLPTTGWLKWSRLKLDEERRALGLPPSRSLHGTAGEGLALVATLPQLEYPRAWPRDVHVTGPMVFDAAHPNGTIPAGGDPLVLVAPSTVKDPEGRLVRAAIEALAGERARLLVTMGGPRREPPGALPPNAVAVDWVDYSRVMPEAALVISHGTHGTVVRALAEGVPVVVSPAMPDDAEHGARVAWAGAGLMIPRRLLAARTLRSVVRRVMSEPGFARRAGQIAAWSREHDGAARGADLVEAYARR